MPGVPYSTAEDIVICQAFLMYDTARDINLFIRGHGVHSRTYRNIKVRFNTLKRTMDSSYITAMGLVSSSGRTRCRETAPPPVVPIAFSDDDDMGMEPLSYTPEIFSNEEHVEAPPPFPCLPMAPPSPIPAVFSDDDDIPLLYPSSPMSDADDDDDLLFILDELEPNWCVL